MESYTTGQWVLLFFFYCLCGWVWESCYVSARQRHWVNRGFLQGPMLPIYGSSAILILFVTLPAAQSPALIFLLGMLAATALEYVTGAVMERLFQVRYWDYTHQRWNLHGYICLTSSLAWGGFSILLVRLVHPPVSRLLRQVPDFWVDPLALALTIVFTVDVVRSVQAALDLRDILARVTEENEDLRRLAKRAEVLSAFAAEELRAFRAQTALETLVLQDRIAADFRQKRESRTLRLLRRQDALEEALRRATTSKLDALHGIAQALETCRARLETAKELTAETVAERRAEIAEALEKLADREAGIRSRSVRACRRSLRVLRANPSARAKRFAEALESLRNLDDSHR